MAAKIDIKNSSRIEFGKNGYRAERVAIVSGITGTAAQWLFNAINDAALPNYGDVHPEIAGLYLNSLTCDALGSDKARVVMSYFNEPGTAGAGNTTSSAQATTVTEQTNLDSAGAAMVTHYQKNLTQYEERFTADVERARVTFDFEFTQATFPKSTIDTYLGKINSVIWNSYAVETILCTAVNVNQRGEDYVVRMSFAYNADTWVFKARTTRSPTLVAHPTTPDAALDLTTGVREYDVYSTVDFTPLGLTL